MPQVYVPPLMRPLANNQEVVEVEGKNVAEILANLNQAYPGFRERLCDGNQLKPGLRVAIDDQMSQLGLLQKVTGNSEVHFIPAVGGG